MKANYKGSPVDLWEISQTGERPDWIQEAFTKNALQWDGKQLKVLSSVLKPSAIGGMTGGFGTGVDVTFGSIGDFIDITNGKVISAKRFSEDYEKIEE